MTWWRRVLRRRALERDLDAELRDHIEREIAEGVRAGQSEADVRRQIGQGGRATDVAAFLFDLVEPARRQPDLTARVGL